MASTHIDYRKIDYDQLIDKPITRVASGVNPNTLTTAGVYDRGDGNRFIVTVDGLNILQVNERKDGYESRNSIDGGTTWSTWDTVQYSDASHKWDVVIISTTEPVDKRETTAWIDTAHDNTLKVYDGSAWMTVSGQSIQIATMPTASSALMGKVFQFIGTTDSNYTHWYFYEVEEDSSVTPATYSWTEVKTQSVDAESVTYDNTTSGLTATNVQDAIDEMNTAVEEIKDIVEVETMPTPGEESEGTIIQYKWATTSDFVHWYFYECVGDGQDPETFSRVNIQVQDNPAQAEVMPTPSAENVGQIIQYAGDTNNYYTHAHFYEVIEDPENPGTYIYKEVEVQDSPAQSEEMPEADEDSVGKIIQYMGDTTASFTHGYFYECVEVAGTDPQEYEWQNVKVQEDKEWTTTIYLTQAQYNALPASKATDGVIYKIYAEESGDITIDADKVDYDNTTSGLTADNVQDAIDEIIETGIGWDITYNPDSPYKPKYHRVGTQAQYDALSQYYTEEENDTVFFCI